MRSRRARKGTFPAPFPLAVSRDTWGAGPKGVVWCASGLAHQQLLESGCLLGLRSVAVHNSGAPAGAEQGSAWPKHLCLLAPDPGSFFPGIVSRVWLGRGSGRMLGLSSPTALQTALHHASEVAFPKLPSDHCHFLCFKNLPKVADPDGFALGAGVAAATGVRSHERV